MDLKESARKCVLALLPYEQSDAELSAYLRGLDARDLLIVYQNWMSRLVHAVPRKVHLSGTLSAKLPTSEHKTSIDNIIQDVEKGDNLTKYLSRGVRVATQLPRTDKKFQRRQDLDLMLTAWDMHHMHLSTKSEPDGFVARANDLLFAVFRKNDAYLIDIMPHGSWARDELLRIARDELPAAQAALVLQGVKGLSIEYTEKEHQKLRNAGINTVRMIGGQATIGAGAITGAGTSLRSSRAADDAIKKLEGFEASWADHPEEIRQIARECGSELPIEPDFQFVITQTLGAGVLETKSKAFFPFPDQ